MLYREIMAVCSEIHTKHINTLCGQNVELLNVKLAVHIVTTGLCILTLHLTNHFSVRVFPYFAISNIGVVYNYPHLTAAPDDVTSSNA